MTTQQATDRETLVRNMNVARSTAMVAEKTNRPVRFQNKCWKAYFAAEDALKSFDGTGSWR